eukprot:8226541-Pyramimonas_sp.AAC.1
MAEERNSVAEIAHHVLDVHGALATITLVSSFVREQARDVAQITQPTYAHCVAAATLDWPASLRGASEDALNVICVGEELLQYIPLLAVGPL